MLHTKWDTAGWEQKKWSKVLMQSSRAAFVYLEFLQMLCSWVITRLYKQMQFASHRVASEVENFELRVWLVSSWPELSCSKFHQLSSKLFHQNFLVFISCHVIDLHPGLLANLRKRFLSRIVQSQTERKPAQKTCFSEQIIRESSSFSEKFVAIRREVSENKNICFKEPQEMLERK